jgi:hypothetical protein
MHPRVNALLRIMSRTLCKENCDSKRGTPNCRSLTNGIPLGNSLIPYPSCLQQSRHPRIVRSTIGGPHWASCSHTSTQHDRNAPARIKSSSGGDMAPIKTCDGNVTGQRNPTSRPFRKHPNCLFPTQTMVCILNGSGESVWASGRDGTALWGVWVQTIRLKGA